MKIILLEFISKFYQVIIVVLCFFIVSLSILSVFQYVQITAKSAELESIHTKYKEKALKDSEKYLLEIQKKQNEIDSISYDYEVLKGEMSRESQIRYKTIEKIVERPIYRNVCLDDDGLSELKKAVKSYDPKQSSDALRSTS